jgi:hypothetical protein
MWDYRKNLKENKERRSSLTEMARKLYLSYPTSAFIDQHEVEYEIRDRVRRLYNIPLSSVQVIGSAKTGFSLIKKTDFKRGESDLDLAIIDASLFNRMWEEAYEMSRGYEATRFQDARQDGGQIVVGSGRSSFLNYLQRGILVPDYLPSGAQRAKIFSDFERITETYKQDFKKVSAFFYCNEFFFQEKLKDTIGKHWSEI